MSFRARIMTIIFLACLICTGAAVFVSAWRITHGGEQALIEKSRAILSRVEAVRSYIAAQGGLNDKIERMKQEFPDGKLSKEAKLEVLKQVPIFASMKVAASEAEKDHFSFRVFSDEPRREENKATAAEREIFDRFLADSHLPELVQVSEEKVVVYRPVRLSAEQGCLACHGNPSSSPWKNGKDIVGYPMENWADGKLHGVFAITSDLAPVKAAAASATWTILGGATLALLIALGLGFVLLRGPLLRLQHVVTSLTESGHQVSVASQEISNSSQALSSSTSEAAASLEETTASTEEMTSMIKLNASHAENAKQLSQDCEVKASDGNREVERLIVSMTGISENSRKIEEITSVIDDIAFQTNLLALNAAVEAARAGEQGKGFSVVAEAVRTLAQRSATSAKEISDLIKASSEGIRKGAAVAESSGKALHEIVTSVQKMSQLNAEISNASQEQAQGVANINKAITELDSVTQQNAAAAEQTAASSEELSAQAQQLHLQVANLNEILTGQANPTPPPRENSRYEKEIPLTSSEAKSVPESNRKKLSSIADFNKAA